MTGDIKFNLDLIPDSTKEEVLNPSANLVGKSLRGVLHFVLDPLVKFSILRDKSLQDFEKKIYEKNETIPVENRDDSKIGLAYKALEDSKYQLNSEELRTLFSNLISSTVDSRKNNLVQPYFSTILKDLSVEDAKILLYFSNSPVLPLVNLKLSAENSPFYKVNVLEHVLLVEDQSLYVPTELASLVRLGLITIEESELQAQKYKEKYDLFKSSELYKAYKNKLPITVEEFKLSKVNVNKWYVSLTPLGTNLLKIVA